MNSSYQGKYMRELAIAAQLEEEEEVSTRS